jgi:NADPH:quinone reductase-like Zn-dependent oxidoreductase
VHDDPSEVKDVGDALTALGNRPYGPWLLGVAAAGFIAYGLYQFAKARYRRIVVTRRAELRRRAAIPLPPTDG